MIHIHKHSILNITFHISGTFKSVPVFGMKFAEYFFLFLFTML